MNLKDIKTCIRSTALKNSILVLYQEIGLNGKPLFSVASFNDKGRLIGGASSPKLKEAMHWYLNVIKMDMEKIESEIFPKNADKVGNWLS